MERPGSAESRRWSVLVAIGVGTFMSALDGSVVNTVLPLLRRDLATSVAQIEWGSSVYLLVVSALLLAVGRAGDLYGHKRTYLAGFAIFVAASVLCGMAASAQSLIAMRGLQGVGAAMLFANSPAILTKAFPAAQRGRALGTQATFTYLGLTAGPSLGGWLAQSLGWRSVFFINIPVGIAGMLLAARAIDDDRPEERGERFDWAGAALFSGALVTAMIVLNQGHAWGWSSPPALIGFTGAVVLLALFVSVERRRKSPMLDLSLFANRVFTASSVSALLNYITTYCVIFVVPFVLIQARGLPAGRAGLVLTAQPIVMAIVAPLSGSMSDRIGSRLLAFSGMSISAVALVALAFAVEQGSLIAIAGALAMFGLGIGLFVAPNNSALMGAAPRQRQGIAAAVLATARNVGMVLGIGLAGAVFTTVLAHGGGSNAVVERGARTALLVSSVVAAAAAVSTLATRETHPEA